MQYVSPAYIAEYTNLTTLKGLKVGDTVEYTQTSTIELLGYTVKCELYGKAND